MEKNHNERACIASLFPACDPPLMTLKAGTGRTILGLPARLAMCCIQKPQKKRKSIENLAPEKTISNSFPISLKIALPCREECH